MLKHGKNNSFRAGSPGDVNTSVSSAGFSTAGARGRGAPVPRTHPETGEQKVASVRLSLRFPRVGGEAEGKGVSSAGRAACPWRRRRAAGCLSLAAPCHPGGTSPDGPGLSACPSGHTMSCMPHGPAREHGAVSGPQFHTLEQTRYVYLSTSCVPFNVSISPRAKTQRKPLFSQKGDCAVYVNH